MANTHGILTECQVPHFCVHSPCAGGTSIFLNFLLRNRGLVRLSNVLTESLIKYRWGRVRIGFKPKTPEHWPLKHYNIKEIMFPTLDYK